MGATNNFIGANFILGQANLSFPNYTIERWHTVLVTYLIVMFCAVVNIYGPHLLDKISRGMLIWNITAFVIVVTVILATNDRKQSASFVFKDFQNSTGFGTAFTTILGLLQSFFGMCCYDAPAHMTEEMRNASREAPKAMVMSVYLGAITGLVFLISVCFCIGNIGETAASSTLVPLIQIFKDSTRSVVGSCFLSSLILVVVLVASNALMVEGSRSLYAFARDRGLPFSRFFAKVEKKRHIPIYAILLAGIVQMALNSIYFGTLTGFNTVISIATEGFCKSFSLFHQISPFLQACKQKLTIVLLRQICHMRCPFSPVYWPTSLLTSKKSRALTLWALIAFRSMPSVLSFLFLAALLLTFQSSVP